MRIRVSSLAQIQNIPPDLPDALTSFVATIGSEHLGHFRCDISPFFNIEARAVLLTFFPAMFFIPLSRYLYRTDLADRALAFAGFYSDLIESLLLYNTL